MGDLQISKFRENCAYCWIGLETQLAVCNCGITLCHNHQKVHLYRNGHDVMYFITKEDDIAVYSPVLTEDECRAIEKGVKSLLNAENRTESLLFESSKIECPHLMGITPADLSTMEEKCEACDVESNLWACFECGYLGCGRKQYGVEGNGHSLQHFSDTRHPLCVFVGKVAEGRSSDTFCYLCDTFVVNYLHKDEGDDTRKTKSFVDTETQATKSTSESTKASESTNEGTTQKECAYVGISNLGNTCYLSSVMQMIAHTVNPEYMESHFMKCEDSPLECLICQTIRVLASIKAKVFVPIIDFARLVFKHFPMFEQNAQQDASEFFIYLVNQIKTAEAEGKMTKITQMMDYELNNVMECECGIVRRRKEESFFLNISFTDKVSTGLKRYFEPVSYQCECGKSGRSLCYFRILPEYLFIIVNRCKEDGEKITDELVSNDIIVQNFLETIPNTEYVSDLMNLGFTKEEVCDALVLSDNDSDKAGNILLGTEKPQLRTNKNYTMHSVVCHRGVSTTSGHYTFVVKEGEELIHIDDDNSKFCSTEDDLKNAYIICYH